MLCSLFHFNLKMQWTTAAVQKGMGVVSHNAELPVAEPGCCFFLTVWGLNYHWWQPKPKPQQTDIHNYSNKISLPLSIIQRQDSRRFRVTSYDDFKELMWQDSASVGDFSLDDVLAAVYFCGLSVRVRKPQIQLFFVVEWVTECYHGYHQWLLEVAWDAHFSV